MSNPDTIWYTRCPVPSPLGIAASFGWIDEAFGRHGIGVRSIGDSPDPSIRESHFKHTLAWSFRQGGNIPAIRARSDGRETRLIGLTWVDEFQAVVALPDSGLREPSDLVGRRVGVPKRRAGIVDFHRATALKGIVSALSLIGKRVDAVTLVDLGITEPVITEQGERSLFGLPRRHPYGRELAALARGEADAVFVKGAEGIVAANLVSARIVAETGHHADPVVRINNGTPRTLTVDAAFVEVRPDLGAELVAQIGRAAAWARVNPDDTRRLVAQEVQTSEAAVLSAYGPDAHLKLALSLEPKQVGAIRHFKDFLLEWGFLEHDIDVEAWIDRRLPTSGAAAA